MKLKVTIFRQGRRPLERLGWLSLVGLLLPLGLEQEALSRPLTDAPGATKQAHIYRQVVEVSAVQAPLARANLAPNLEPIAEDLRRDASVLRDELQRLTTEDGWELAIHRVVPDVILHDEPILMIHGLCSNHATWDLNDEQSIQRTLAAQGFDTWALDLRGAGDSERPAPGRYLAWDYSIDDLIHYDGMAALDHVLEQTGAPKAFLMGHSMGGLIVYAMAGTEPIADRVAGIVTLAGAGVMGSDGSGENPATQALMSFLGLVAPFVVDDGVVPTEQLTYLATSVPGYSWLLEIMARWAGIWLWNPLNVTVPLIDQMAAEAVGNTNTTILQQFLVFSHKYDTFSFAGWVGMADASEYFLDYGFVSYFERLATIKVPALVLSGGGDRIVGAHNVREVYAKLGSADKQYLDFSRDSGFSYDYGHVDLVMGTMAPVEVYPVLSAWIKARAH